MDKDKIKKETEGVIIKPSDEKKIFIYLGFSIAAIIILVGIFFLITTITNKPQKQSKAATSYTEKKGENLPAPVKFSEDIPTPKDSNIKLITSKNENGTGVSFETKESKATMLEYYKKEMKTYGWTLDKEEASAIAFHKGEKKATILILEANGIVGVNISVLNL